jgi:hypothetical protein
MSPLSRRFRFKVLLLVGLIRLTLWLLPFRLVRRLAGYLISPARRRDRTGWPAIPQLTQSVTAVSRYVPQATCLTQALAAQILLHRYGHPASLRIGVARSQSGKFEAHAWLESDGVVVIGGTEAELRRRYSPLPTLEWKNK